MKTFLKISVVILGLAAGSLPLLHAADASDSAKSEGRHPQLRALLKHRAAVRAAVARRLDLTAEQKTQLKTGREKTAAALRALRADPNLTREQKRAQAKQTVETARAEMRHLLTPEQQQKLKSLREKMQERRGHRV